MKKFTDKLNKKQMIIIGASVAFLVIFLIILSVFFFKNDKVNPDGTMIDKYGETIIPYTNTDGETVVNEEGKLIVIATKPNGQYEHDEHGQVVTQVATEPAIIETKGVFETPTYKIALPKGWDQVGSQILMLRHSSSTAKMDIAVENKDDRTFEEYVDGFFEFIKIDKSLFTIDTVKIDNLDSKVTTISRTYNDGSKDIFTTYYAYEKNKMFYFISCLADSQEDFDTADFGGIIALMEYK